ncbi:hypothetical protein [Candidatus Poriferisocius sp.]|uniref:hypothetical protein n=1 Tax=Candidatus Poriferisocius sp. TaxID=3101276 RepID=UPI003B52CD79
MQAAIATLIGVLGTGFVSLLFQFMRMMGARLDRIESKVDNLGGELKNHGERLARIETTLGINPPAEAA